MLSVRTLTRTVVSLAFALALAIGATLLTAMALPGLGPSHPATSIAAAATVDSGLVDTGLDDIAETGGNAPRTFFEAELAYGGSAGEADILHDALQLPSRYERTVTVRSGDTLGRVFAEARIADVDAQGALAAISQVFSPRDLQPGQAIRLTLESADSAIGSGTRLVAMNLQPDLTSEIQVARQGDAFTALTRGRDLTTQSLFGAGVITATLFEATGRAGVPRRVASELIRAFSYDVDFQRDIHNGDRFEVMYEAEVDEDGRTVNSGEVQFLSLTLGGKEHRLYRFTPKGGRAGYYTAEGVSARKTLLKTPVDGARMSSGFGMRKHPILGYSRMHRGVDFAAPTGTPIYAAGDGVVERAGRNGSYGNYVRIRHNGTYSTAYAHLSRITRGLKAGTHVSQGQVIGKVGTTGRSTGPHLHYEVLKAGTQIDPRGITSMGADKLGGTDLANFRRIRDEIDGLLSRHRPALVAGGNPATQVTVLR